MPHCGHLMLLLITAVTAGVATDTVIGVRTLRSRSAIGRRDTAFVRANDPDEPENMLFRLAVE